MLDLNKAELTLSVSPGESLEALCITGALDLTTTIYSCLQNSDTNWNDYSHRSGDGLLSSNQSKNKPIYHASAGHKADAKMIQTVILSHVSKIAASAKSLHEKLRYDKQTLEDQLNRMSFSTDPRAGVSLDINIFKAFSDSSDDENEERDAEEGEEHANQPNRAEELLSLYQQVITADKPAQFRPTMPDSDVRDASAISPFEAIEKSVIKLNRSNFVNGKDSLFMTKLMKTQVSAAIATSRFSHSNLF